MTHKKSIHFEVSERKILLRLMDLLAVFFGLRVLANIFSYEYLILNKQHTLYVVVLGIYITIVHTIFELYDLQKASKLDSTAKNLIISSFFVALFYLSTPYVTPILPEQRMLIVYFYLTLCIPVLLWRVCYIQFIESPRFYKKVLLIADIGNVDSLVKTIQRSDPNYKIVGFLNSEPSKKDAIKYKGLIEFQFDTIEEVILDNDISEIIVARFNDNEMMSQVYENLILLVEQGYKVRDYTQVYEELLKKVPLQFVGDDFYKYLPYSRNNENKLYRFIRRVSDIIFSIIGLMIMICILPIVVLGNIFANKGPLFYKQKRIGKNGVPFKIFKLRTMVVDAEYNGAKWADKNDKRVTPFGRFLRNSRLDEIPQFWNILKGDMNIIGPRPERPFFVNQLSETVPFYEIRHIIKPGLTGWAQVNARYGSSIDDSTDKLQYDLYYIKHRGLFIDLNIFIKTFSTIIYYRGR